jgi:hypothetical protein
VGLTSACSGAREANFTWFLRVPLARPLMRRVRRQHSLSDIVSPTDGWYKTIGGNYDY